MPQIFDQQVIQAHLDVDRPWSAYALADLDPVYFPFTSWFGAADQSAIALLYRAFTRTIVLYVGQAQNVSTLMDEVDDSLGGSAEFYAVLRPEILSLLESRYDVREKRPMIRMVLDPSHFRPAAGTATRLNPSSLGAVQELYGDEPPDFFSSDMLKNGIYYGIFKGDNLAAVGGTHVIAPTVGVAGLGNIYTRKERRGLGYATRVTSAVTQDLLQIAISTIVLNVRQNNSSAIHVYERLGFRTYCDYYEVIAFRPNRGFRKRC